VTIWHIRVHLVHFSGFGFMHHEKSGNPGLALLTSAFVSHDGSQSPVFGISC
jgi:hypothetical protein